MGHRIVCRDSRRMHDSRQVYIAWALVNVPALHDTRYIITYLTPAIYGHINPTHSSFIIAASPLPNLDRQH